MSRRWTPSLVDSYDETDRNRDAALGAVSSRASVTATAAALAAAAAAAAQASADAAAAAAAAAQATAYGVGVDLAGFVSTKGAANGLATLDADVHVPLAQLALVTLAVLAPVFTTAEKPTANAAAPVLIRIRDAGVPEVWQACVYTAAGAYKWKTIFDSDE